MPHHSPFLVHSFTPEHRNIATMTAQAFDTLFPAGEDHVEAHKIEQMHDSARGSPAPSASSETPNGFDRLITDINTILGPSNGIDSAGVDVEELKHVMRAYDGPEVEWQKYAFADQSRAYTRNLVDNCNGKSNLLVLVWSPGKASPIHDHANAHCVMRILKGNLTETVYGWPCEQAGGEEDSLASQMLCSSTAHTCRRNSDTSEPHALQIRRSTTYAEGQVTYMSDRLGLHRIRNVSESEFAVSLHLYTVSCACS